MLIINLLIIIGCFALVAFLPYAAAIVMVAVTAMLFILAAYDAGQKA